MVKEIIRRLKRLHGDDSGVVMLETVLVFPIQLMLMMVIFQLAHIYVAANVMQYAALQGTRTVLVNYRGNNEEEACRKGVRAAWTIMSTINNAGGGTNRIRVPANHYAFPSLSSGGQENIVQSPQLTYLYGMDDVSSIYAGTGDDVEIMMAFRTPSLPGRPETEIGGQVGYWLELVVPVGGPFIYHAMNAMGHPVKVDPTTKRGMILMQQNSRLPKPWPH
ncbi:MAG: pilus assembly protein [Planctomycetes bacterium]|nr:pilus assembly protein [Planctomycetota bacterium]